ncbi:MAG: DUF3761 domain-containing protein [Steroidobacteraceae bacterium]
MKALVSGLCLCAALLAAGASLAAQTPASAPDGSSGVCKDGSYTSAASKKGACRGHKGVQEWYGVTSTAGALLNPQRPRQRCRQLLQHPRRPRRHGRKRFSALRLRATATAAPGGGAGLVWLNAGTKVYHCSTDKWYGRTKQGEYLTEAEAKAKGAHPDHGKPCT